MEWSDRENCTVFTVHGNHWNDGRYFTRSLKTCALLKNSSRFNDFSRVLTSANSWTEHNFKTKMQFFLQMMLHFQNIITVIHFLFPEYKSAKKGFSLVPLRLFNFSTLNLWREYKPISFPGGRSMSRRTEIHFRSEEHGALSHSGRSTTSANVCSSAGMETTTSVQHLERPALSSRPSAKWYGARFISFADSEYPPADWGPAPPQCVSFFRPKQF